MLTEIFNVMKQYKEIEYTIRKEKLVYLNLIAMANKMSPISHVDKVINPYIQLLLDGKEIEIFKYEEYQALQDCLHITIYSSTQRDVQLQYCLNQIIRGGQATIDTNILNLIYPKEMRGSINERREVKYRLTEIIFDIFGNPLIHFKLDPDVVSHDVFEMSLAIIKKDRYDDVPVLADLLEESGCDRKSTLEHCRIKQNHYHGCLVVDAIYKIGKEKYNVQL